MSRKLAAFALAALLPLTAGWSGYALAGEHIKVSSGHHGSSSSSRSSNSSARSRALRAQSPAGLTTAAPVYPAPAPGEPGGNDRGEFSVGRNYQYRTNDRKKRFCDYRRVDATLGDALPANVIEQCRLGAYVANAARRR